MITIHPLDTSLSGRTVWLAAELRVDNRIEPWRWQPRTMALAEPKVVA